MYACAFFAKIGQTTLKITKFAANYESDITKRFRFPSIMHFQKLE